MQAVIKTGGKQFRVAADDVLTIEKLGGETGDKIEFNEVLMVGDKIGAPFVKGAKVVAEVVEQTRGPKIINFKERRRQNSKRKKGHRQELTRVKITTITAPERQRVFASDFAPSNRLICGPTISGPQTLSPRLLRTRTHGT